MKIIHSMPDKPDSRKLTADEIADMADRGEDVSRFFTRMGKLMPPILPKKDEKGRGQEV